MNLKEEIKTLDLHAQIGDLKGVDKENKIVEISLVSTKKS